MAWTTPGTAVAGAVLEASFWNSNVRDNTLALYAQSQYPYRNMLYNGAVQVHQRGTSTASITSVGYYTADRWQVGNFTMGTWTQTVENDAPTGTGLRKSLKTLCTTADAAPAAGDRIFISQALEGFDVQRLAKGTTSAQTLTLSFWVKSNLTGTFIASLYDNDNNRHCSRSYTISAAATWERKEITFPADTTGAFDNDNAASLFAAFYLGAGSNFTSGTLATSWASYTAANDAVGQTNVAAAINNYLQVTGVQLEAGSVATPFEFLPFGDELARCQRYYYRMTGGGGATFARFGFARTDSASTIELLVYHPIPLRAVATTLEVSNVSSDAGAPSASTLATAGQTTTITPVQLTPPPSPASSAVYRVYGNNNTAAYIGIGAEL